MEKENLTAKQVEHMQPAEKRMEVPAGPPAGLYLVLQPKTGRKSWMFRYRFLGRTRGMTLSKPYPDLKLAPARAEAWAAIELLKEGKDPAVIQAVEQRESEPNSFE